MLTIKANNLNRKMKREYFSNKLESCEGNIKETWKTVNQLINKRSKTTNILSIKEDEKVISNPLDIAETMNHFFYNIGKKILLRPWKSDVFDECSCFYLTKFVFM